MRFHITRLWPWAPHNSPRILMHGHHNTLFSFYRTAAGIQARLTFIPTGKPEEERALRAALIQDVTDLLPRSEAREAFSKARLAANTKRESLQRITDEYLAALDAVRAQLTSLQEAGRSLEGCDLYHGAYILHHQAYLAARDAYTKSQAKLHKAWEQYDAAEPKARDAEETFQHGFDVDAFHRQHCHPHCPWDGKTIFAKGVSVDVLES